MSDPKTKTAQDIPRRFFTTDYQLPILDILDNHLPVEPPVLNENLAGMPSANHHSSKVQPLYVALQRVRIQFWLAAVVIQLHSQTLDELVVRMVSR
jgi:hypothetical protein